MPCAPRSRLALLRKLRAWIWIVLILFVAVAATNLHQRAAEPGLPFVEDFADTNLRDGSLTSADWSTTEQALLLNATRKRPGAFLDAEGVTLGLESVDMRSTLAIALGDVNGDGDLDVVVGNDNINQVYLNKGPELFRPFDEASPLLQVGTTPFVAISDLDRDGRPDIVAGDPVHVRLFFNNSSDDPFVGVEGIALPAPGGFIRAAAVGDVDGDEDADIVVGTSLVNRVYFNNGTSSPFSDAVGVAIGSEATNTPAVALADLNNDGHLDFVAGNDGVNRLYLNNGTSDPWDGAEGQDLGSDARDTTSLAPGDVDGDGNVDVVSGNEEVSRLYVNNGTGDPFAGVAGEDIGNDVMTGSVALGDVDSDGDLDLVTGRLSGTNRLYLGDGSVQPFIELRRIDISPDADETRSIALGDVDDDGYLDLVAGIGPGLQFNKYYRNEGKSWSGSAGAVITADDDLTRAIYVGDVNGDGAPDVVAGNHGFNRLYLNNGTDSPFDGVVGGDAGSIGAMTNAVVLGDLDGDGKLDLIAGNSGSNRLFINDDTIDPFTGPGAAVGPEVDDTASLALADLNGDGLRDVVAGNVAGINRWYPNNGTSDPFAGVTGVDLGADLGDTLAIALADVDRDGDVDVVAGNDGRNRLYLNNGTALPFDGVGGIDITTDEDTTQALALVDVDGDGAPDLVAANQGVNRLYLNNGTGNPWAGVTGSDITDLSSDSRSVALADIDRDGDPDLVVAEASGPNRLYVNDGGAVPWSDVEGIDLTSDEQSTLAVVLADVDGDGQPDPVMGNDDQANRYYANNGLSDPFYDHAAEAIGSEAEATEALAAGDVDGDGDRDLVFGLDGVNLLYRNNGTFDPWAGVSPVEITTDAAVTRAVALSDVDKDGDLDLVAGNLSAGNRLYLNNGTADPWDGVRGSDIGSETDKTTSIALGDVDGDGGLDLVVGNFTEPNRLYLNNGTADPWAGVSATDITADIQLTLRVELVDADGDGDLDLIAGNSGTANRLYLNNGTSDPWNGAVGMPITSDQDDTFSLALGDVDRDGDVDLVAGNTDSTNRLYLNNGTDDPWAGAIGLDISSDEDTTGPVSLADLDADGDLDLVTGNFGVNRLYLNNGTADPWAGVTAIDVTDEADSTLTQAVSDFDRDGIPEIVVGNASQLNRYYRNTAYDATLGRGVSLEIDLDSVPFTTAALTPTVTLPPNTTATYWLSNNGGDRWYQAHPGRMTFFDSASAPDDAVLKWRTRLDTRSPVVTPRVDTIQVTSVQLPLSIGDRVWVDLDVDGIQDPGEPGLASVETRLLDASSGVVQVQFTDSNGFYEFTGPGVVYGRFYSVQVIVPPGFSPTLPKQGSDPELDSDLELPGTPGPSTRPFRFFGPGNDTQWDAGLLLTPDCSACVERDIRDDQRGLSSGLGVDWNGSQLVTVWNDFRGESAELFFARTDATGNKIGGDQRITADDGHLSVSASIVWNGDDYGLVWSDARDGMEGREIYFGRMTADGTRIGEDVRVTQAAETSELPDLVWTGNSYGLVWRDFRPLGPGVYFARLDPSGNKIGEDTLIAESGDLARLEWSGTDFGVVWEDDGIFFTRFDTEGNRIGEDVTISTGNTVDPDLAWTGGFYGVVYRESSPTGVKFLTLDASGTVLTEVVTIAVGRRPRIAFGSTTFGVVSDAQFVQVSAFGDLVGPVVPYGRSSTRVSWTGQQFHLSAIEPNTRVVLNVLGCEQQVDCDLDGTSPGEDCDDLNAAVFPAAPQICDGFNNDCLDPTWPTIPADEANADGDDFLICQGDCDDANADVFPGAPQICDRINNDCDDPTWPVAPAVDRDDDSDTFSDCEGDCDDTNPAVSPLGVEVCNGIDDNCDTLVDEDDLGQDTDVDGVHNLCDNCPTSFNPGQADTDLDRVGNGCDNCLFDVNPGQEDLDSDARGDVCDNCPATPNTLQDDLDVDRVGDACDNCFNTPNPSQSDRDDDFEGDACDLDDGLVYVTFRVKNRVRWQDEQGFDSWNSYRGDLSVLVTTGVYSQPPGSNALAARQCGLEETSVVDSPALDPGETAFYLTTGSAAEGESDLGETSAGLPRPNTNPCPGG